MIFTIHNCAIYFKSAITVKSVTNMQEKLKFFAFFSDEIETPTPTEAAIFTQ